MLMSGQMPAHQTLTTQALYQGCTYLRVHRNGKKQMHSSEPHLVPPLSCRSRIWTTSQISSRAQYTIILQRTMERRQKEKQMKKAGCDVGERAKEETEWSEKIWRKREEIHGIRKLIRSKLRGHTNTANPQPEKQEPSLNEQFRDNFWKTCERIFKLGENILPVFSVGSGPSTLNQYSATNRIQSHITHVQNTSILATLILTSVVHHPTTSFNPILIHCNTTPPFCHLVTQIFQSLHSRSCPASLEQTPASIATNI